MWKKLFYSLIAAPAALLLTTTASDAAISYQYKAGQPTYTAPANSTLMVPLFLKETLTGGSTSLITQDDGIFGVGIQIDRSSTNLPSTPSILNMLTENAVDFGGFTSGSVSPTTGYFTVNIGNEKHGILVGNTGGGAVTNPATDSSVYFAVATIMTGGPGTTTFTLSAAPRGPNTVTNLNFYNLDITRTGTDAYTGTSASPIPTFTVIVVPEPASVGLVMLGGAVLLARRRGAPTLPV